MSSPTAWSIKNGDLDQVRQAITEANVNADLDGRKPIHFAADYGQNEVIDYLLSKGADINAVDSHGITALLAAIWEGHTESVKLLLSRGARRDVKAPDGSSYAECADKAEIKVLLMAQNCC
uniref:Myotrophin n=1 Tax=Plectus sambesii TaxID=2011161 RepID=A0A914XED6_9BILA